MKIIVCVAIALLGVQAIPTKERAVQEWEAFKSKHVKTYADEKEESLRKSIFLKKLQHIEEHNEKFEQGLVTYKLGVNQFSDYTEEEIHQLTHGLRYAPVATEAASRFVPPNGYYAPDYFDWRDRGVIGAIKNQEACGSCWAFSAIGALEPQLAINWGRAVVLSEQNLVDCITDNTCKGGWMATAYQYIIDNGGIDTEAAYPYEARDGVCHYTSYNSGATIRGWYEIEMGNEQDMKVALASGGPLAVAIDVNGDWGGYSSGVYYNATCTKTDLGHAVTVVGYGTENGQDYWLVRNSWGPTWGDNGHIKMARNRDSNCGIGQWAMYPFL